MSHCAVQWALKVRAEGLSPSARILLLALADHHNPRYGCFPAVETLAEDLLVNRRTIFRLLSELESLQLISRRRTRYESRYQFPEDSGVKSRGDISVKREVAQVTHRGDNLLISTDSTPYMIESVMESVITDSSKIDSSEGQYPIMKAEDIVQQVAMTVDRAKRKFRDAVVNNHDPVFRVKPKMLWHYWRDLHVALLPKVTIRLGTAKEMRMLLDAHNQVGPKFIDALPTVMENWIDFGKFINSRGGKVVSLTPMVSVVLKHAGLVVSYHEHRTAPAVLDEHVGFPVQEPLTNEDVKSDPIEDEDPFDLETQLETCRKAELDVDIRRSFEK